ncbi:Alpha/Beta hydrolase protein [Jimgerdemannia flammicorona]|uniref:sn-1-specific diacylglycerol lipase n=1 Tax=Jimgerdemannia flammicorona TaxID=994334 RepID=A0A432ZYQ0_9FUNG|nr:Alpha/Beta hydrolase protein [Jimgerdemannia flammicorona]
MGKTKQGNTSLVTLASGSIGPRLQGQLHAADDRHHGTGEVLCGTAKVRVGCGRARQWIGFICSGEPPRPQVINLELVERANHYFKHAVIAYPSLIILHFPIPTIADVIRLRSNRNAIIRFLRIPPEDLLGYEYGIRKGAAFHPSYFVALDSPQAAVVLGIRGTWSFYDAITDLVCEYRPWKDGLAHSGMLASAQWFFTHIIPQIFNYVHNSPVTLNSLIITGHSLGAGTAAILTMMVVDHLEELRRLSENPDFTVHSYGFGPVAATSYELGQRYKDYIDAFVTQDDLVGRMSYGTAMQLKEMIVGTINAVEDIGGASKVGLVDPGGGRWKEV